MSGRGVGMDVVRRNVEGMGGRITVESTPGRGCRFTLGLPLTLAVLDGTRSASSAASRLRPVSPARATGLEDRSSAKVRKPARWSASRTDGATGSAATSVLNGAGGIAGEGIWGGHTGLLFIFFY